MAQDTRKDPRAKVLTMTVRYKSATIDEFIEHHSHDVSRGGMFIKTPSPFPPGTLLKFEVKIAEDQKVMQGVGRVVWKREPAEASGDERPAGMGVKFIKIDEESKRLIDQLVSARGEGGSAFEAGTDLTEPAVPSAKHPAQEKPAVESKPATPIRKATMIGLGSIGHVPEKQEKQEQEKQEKQQPAEQAQESFFPKTEPEKEQPAPEDRTVMKQAAELLQDALREAGGSLEEVGATKPPEAKAEAEPRGETKAAEEKPEEKKPEEKKPEEKKPEEEKPEEKKPEERPAAAARVERPDRKQPSTGRAPVSARAPAPAERAEGGGGGRVVLLLLGVAVVAGGIWYVMRPKPPAPSIEPSAEMSAVTAPSATESAANVVPEAAANPVADAAAAAPEAGPTPSASVAASAKPTPSPPPAPTHVRRVWHRPKRRPKPEPKPTATVQPTAKPEATATAKAVPTSKPKPKTKPAPNDNPY